MGYTCAFYYAAAVALILPGTCSAQKIGKAERSAIDASPEEASKLVNIKNDALDTVAVVTTEPFYRAKQGLLGLTTADKFVRVFINKATGEQKYQIYIWLTYGGEWWFFNRANYETPSGPKSVDASRLDSDVSCGRYGCRFTEHVAFEVPESLMRSVGSEAVAGVENQWHFKIGGKRGDIETTTLLKSEIAGAVIAADRISATYKK